MYTDVRAALIGDTYVPSLSPGRSLFRGTALRSDDGRFWLWMQSDGNLVLYDCADRTLWTSNTFGKGDSTLWMQSDGNLVLYPQQPTPVTASWASNTMR